MIRFKFFSENDPKILKGLCEELIINLIQTDEWFTTIFPKKYNYKNLEITVDFINYTTDPTFGYPIFFSGAFFINKENHEIHYSFLHPERALNII